MPQARLPGVPASLSAHAPAHTQGGESAAEPPSLRARGQRDWRFTRSMTHHLRATVRVPHP
jgi:hypothetical protein